MDAKKLFESVQRNCLQDMNKIQQENAADLENLIGKVTASLESTAPETAMIISAPLLIEEEDIVHQSKNIEELECNRYFTTQKQIQDVNSEANQRRLQHVEACFGSSGQPLTIPGRVLVGEGVLVKMCRKKPKPRQFFLFNDILVYGNILISKKRYNKQHIIPLEDVELDNLEDDADLGIIEMKNGWLVKTRSKSFAVYAATSTEKKEWMLHIQRCVQDRLAKSGKSAATDHAAVWIPDSEAPRCMVCRKTQFSVIQRRHHCRACGKVTCGPCSSKRFLLPGVSRRPARVCEQCFRMLTGGRGTTDLPPTTHDDEQDSSGEDLSDDDDVTPAANYDRVPTFYGPHS